MERLPKEQRDLQEYGIERGHRPCYTGTFDSEDLYKLLRESEKKVRRYI